MNLVNLFRAEIPDPINRVLDYAFGAINNIFTREHNADGSHATAPLDVTFNPTNFTGSGAMTWTMLPAAQVTFSYLVLGKLMWVSGYWDTTTIAGTPAASLYVAIPGGYVAARKVQTASIAFDNGVTTPTFNRVEKDGTKIEIGRSDVAAWTASAANTYVRVHLWFWVK